MPLCFFDFHSESFRAALLHIPSNKAVIYQPVSTLSKLLMFWTGLDWLDWSF